MTPSCPVGVHRSGIGTPGFLGTELFQSESSSFPFGGDPTFSWGTERVPSVHLVLGVHGLPLRPRRRKGRRRRRNGEQTDSLYLNRTFFLATLRFFPGPCIGTSRWTCQQVRQVTCFPGSTSQCLVTCVSNGSGDGMSSGVDGSPRQKKNKYIFIDKRGEEGSFRRGVPVGVWVHVPFPHPGRGP